jgi:phospholipase/carboxylesterase
VTSIVVHNPSAPERLVLLFHGVGALPQNMVTLGHAIAEADPLACVVSVASPDPSDTGGGFQWFSVRGITEENRPARVAEVMPAFVACVQDWQAKAGIGAENTTLIGFSQGAIMALESTQQPVAIAGRVIALSGRFAAEPHAAPPCPVHLIHGDADPIIAAIHARQAHDQLAALGAEVTLDILSGLGHTIDSAASRRVLAYLQSPEA